MADPELTAYPHQGTLLADDTAVNGGSQEQDSPVDADNHRQREILEQLQLAGGACRIRFLAERLRVSEQTIRRNVQGLVDRGAVAKSHGGVALRSTQGEPPFQQRMAEQPQAKRRIAAALADTIQDGDSLFLDIGSTTAYVAQALQKHRQLLVVTNSVAVAYTLATRNDNRVYLAGGELRQHDGGAFDKAAIDFIAQFDVRYAVVSTAAIDARHGFMVHDLQEATMARIAMSHATHRVVVADASKFGRQAPIRLLEPDQIDILYTDREPSASLAETLRRRDVKLVIAT